MPKPTLLQRLPALRPRERLLALSTGGLVGTWAVVSLLLQPLWDRQTELREQVDTQTQRLESYRRLLEDAPVIERRYLDIAPYFEDDTEAAQGAFLDQLETLSRAANLRLNLKPRSTKPDPKLDRFEVELDVEGSQQGVFEFLDAILSMPKLIQIERLRIASVPSREQLLRANLVIQKLTPR
jgi:Tfp pilus assembly protein PilO